MDDLTKEELESARVLFAGSCTFVAGTESLDRLPPMVAPEIGVVGRSNVGKSSLLNALTGRKTLARVSHTPGRTQQLNFFNLGDRLVLVDMPGYGFAKVSKAQSRAWNHLVRSYLRGRANLRLVLVLVDARRGIQDQDHDVLTLLDEAGVASRVVFTKADEVKPAALDEGKQAVEDVLLKHPAAYPQVIVTSSFKGTGLAELRAVMAQFAT